MNIPVLNIDTKSNYAPLQFKPAKKRELVNEKGQATEMDELPTK